MVSKIMKGIFCFLCLVLFLLLNSCSSENTQHSRVNAWFQEKEKIKVLSTIGMIDDLVRAVGGVEVNHVTLILGNIDPHSYNLVKGDGEKLQAADIIFYNGVGLEHGPSLRKSLEESPKAISLGDTLCKRFPQRFLKFDGLLDPHFWMDVSLWRSTVPILVKELIKLAPQHADYFKENGRRLMEEMQDEHEKIKKMMLEIPEKKRFFVSSHDAFNYFAKAYLAVPNDKTEEAWEVRCVSPEGLSPETQISTSDIQRIIDHMKQYNINVLFPESNVSKDSINKILDAGSSLGMDLIIAENTLFADAMGKEGTEEGTYLGMLRYNARVIKKYLNGECHGVRKGS